MAADPAAGTRRGVVIATAAAVALAALLRGWRFLELTPTHFDEGVYAFGGSWPGGLFYSPPVYPTLVGVLAHAGLGSLAGPAISLLASLATLLLAARIASRLAGPWAGVLAAWGFALDGMQIAFARVGLTDALVTLLMLMSILVGLQAVRGAAPLRWSLLAGMLAGFTWNTKYSGFLPVCLVFFFLDWTDMARSLRRWVVIGIVAFACYLPWLLHVDQTVGLLALLAHQRGYSEGISAVLPGLADAAAGWRTLSSDLLFALPIGAMASMLASQAGGLRRPAMFLLMVGIAAVGMLAAISRFAPLIPLLFALIGIATFDAGPDSRRLRVGLACTIAVLLVLPGCYHFYLRLWLPTESLLLLLASVGAVSGPTWLGGRATRRHPAGDEQADAPCNHARRDATDRYMAWIGWAAGMLVLGVAFARSFTTRQLLPATPTGYTVAADAVARRWQQAGRGTVYGLVRPPLVYELGRRGVPVRRLAGWEGDGPPLRAGDLLLVESLLYSGAVDRPLLDQVPADLGPIARLDESPDRLPAQLMIFAPP